ncbi:MAG: hypothetical protein GVY36_00095 [Verrucomicrobia bacterium]|jgi:RHS repeat-associated protein|nr:hypothetical protein [Verrucomicrobiota bacterium]
MIKTTSIFVKSARWLRLLALTALCLAAPLHAVNRSSDPDPDKPDDDPCTEVDESAGCVSFGFYFPILPLEEGLGDQQFRIVQREPSPSLFTPAGLDYSSVVLTYVASITDAADLPVGIAHEFEITNVKNEAMRFQVKDGESSGRTVAGTDEDYRVRLLDASGEPVASDPVSFRVIRKDSSQIDYPAFKGRTPQRFVTEQGRLIDLSTTLGSAVEVKLSEGFFRQIKSVSGLANIVVIDDFSYEIRLYTPDNSGIKGTEGLYEPTGDPYRTIQVVNPTGDPLDNDWVRIVDTQGPYEKTTDWRYVPAAKDWAMTRGGGLLTEQIIITEDTATGDEVKTVELRNENDELVSRKRSIIHEFPWGQEVVQETEDPDGIALTTTYGFVESTTADGYGKKNEIISPDGSWTRYTFDAEGRKISQIEPWLDSSVSAPANQAMETIYAYQALEPSDSVEDFDQRPRTVTERILGVEVARTYYAYFIDSLTGDYVEIEERTVQPSAAYGAPANLRTTRRYYGAATAPVENGRLKSIEYPDGTIETHSYSQNNPTGEYSADADFVETIDRLALVADTPTPVAGKSIRTVQTKDPRANLVSQTSYVYDGSDWQISDTMEQDYTAEVALRQFQLLETRRNGRISFSQTWNGRHIATRTDEFGTVTSFFYDPLDRLELEVKTGHGGRPDIFTTYDRSLGALDCGCDGERIMTRTAGGLELTSHKKTDSVGRHSETLDENGYTSNFSYIDNERVTTRTSPDGSTVVTEKHLDGRLKSITGTGVIPEYYTYGVHADGTQWTRVDTADATFHTIENISTATDLRYRKTTFDVAGRMIREESPAFTGGTITHTMEYNDRGLLAKQTETGRDDTLFEYDSLANLVRSGLDINANGSLNLASADRITETETLHQQDGAGHWFAVTTTTVYPETGSATAVKVATNKRRLSGFITDASLGTLASEQISVDVHDNETVRQTWIDHDAKTVTQLEDNPESQNNAFGDSVDSGDNNGDGFTWDVESVTINGLLVSRNSPTVLEPTIFDYDALERRISVKDPRHQNAATTDYYTSTRQIFTQTDADGNTTAFEYYDNGETGAGQVKAVTDARLQKSYFAYDDLGRQTHTWGETDYPQAYGYNAYGELATLTTWRDASDSIDFTTATWPAEAESEGGDTTTWTYDAATGLLNRKEYADTNGTDYTYDSANRLAVRTWARDGGLDTTYGYDAATGELLTVDYEDLDTADITYTYDRLGRQFTVTDATGTRSFDYDDATLQLDTETLDTTFYDGLELTRSYDALGRSTGYSLNDSASSALSAVNYSYESSGRLSTVSDGTDTFTYAYENNANLLASLTGPVHSVGYDYEGDRNLMTNVDNKVSGISMSVYSYQYNELGQRGARTQTIDLDLDGTADSNSTESFEYDKLGQIDYVLNDVYNDPKYEPNYSYDKIGNRSGDTVDLNGTTNYIPDELNQYDSVGGVLWDDPIDPTKGYDDDGNFIGDGSWQYTWNNENRLSSATNGTVTIDFTYDYQGRLVKKDDGTDIKVYVYDGWNRIATFDEDSSSVLSASSFFLWGLDLSGSMQGAGGVGGLLKEGDRYPLYDANGNIMQKLDGTGTAVMSVDYDPFGNIINGQLVGDYGFSTKPLVDDLDWYYYGFRYYDPVTGRWPSRDPIKRKEFFDKFTEGMSIFEKWEFEQGISINLYAAMHNSPIMELDVLGLFGCSRRGCDATWSCELTSEDWGGGNLYAWRFCTYTCQTLDSSSASGGCNSCSLGQSIPMQGGSKQTQRLVLRSFSCPDPETKSEFYDCN